MRNPLITCLLYITCSLASGLLVPAALAESLYNEQAYRSLASDQKARRVGDVLTVQIIENSSAATAINTTAARKTDVSLDLGLARNPSITANANANHQFDGGGKTVRSGKLLAQMSVTVIALLPNGDFRVAGEQLLEVNDEQQKIRLEGRVRPQDINESNVVLSTRLADAKINYLGEGELSQRQRPSWWSKIFRILGF